MTTSIRKFLLFNLLLSVAATTSLTAIGNLFLDNREIQRHLDEQLMQTTLIFESLVSGDINQRDLKIVQDKINDIPRMGKYFTEVGHQFHNLKEYHDKFEFQVWSEDGKLLLNSVHAPNGPLSDGTIGFSTRYIDNKPWRIFTTYAPKSNINIVVAERYDIRDELERQITKDDIYIMLITYPLLGFLIWIIVGRGLNTLQRVAREVAHRAPNFLEPVDMQEVPHEIKPLVDELNKLFLRLQQAFEREKRFSADAAHELRTPLAALKTHAQVSLRTTDEVERLKSLRHIISGVNRCSHVVQQLLTMSRLVPEATLTTPVKVSLTQVASEVIADLVPMAVSKSIELELDSPSPDVFVMGDATALNILLRNLIDNAIRYTPNGSFVLTKLTVNNHNITLSVIDNGPGIPPEYRSRVFERFFRILGNKEPGSGLGLAIVQQIVTLHKANIRLGTPENGRGLQIDVLFPR